jgi:hypothetical protein
MRLLARVLGVLLAGLALAAPTRGWTQGTDVAVERSARQVRKEQRRFEMTRLRSLPLATEVPSRCDERVGRFCYWYDADEGPPEPDRVANARRRLLARLDSVAELAPDDDWLRGQRVRYWVEAGHPDSAELAVAGCAANDWWCHALRGYARHEAGREPEAEASFDSALAVMPEEERCQWSDVSLLLPDDRAKRYRRLPCAERAAIERRLWWLARPLWSRAGDDGRSEHYARVTLSRILRGARGPYAMAWAEDLHEMGVRFGWPSRWSRRPPSPSEQIPSVVGHEPSPSFAFLPDPRLLDDPLAAAPESWRPMEPVGRARYAPRYARTFDPLPAQLAVLRRGDSLLVVAARGGIPEPGDSAALAAAASEDDTLRVAREPAAGAPHVIALVAPDHPMLASVELVRDSARVARTRLALTPPPRAGLLGLSHVLLHAPDDSLGDAPALERVLPAMLGEVAVAAPGRVGAYWELYGLPPGRQRVRVALTITGERPGWFGRLSERLRGMPRRAPVSLQWEDVPVVAGPVTARAVTVELPALPPGRYEMQLRVRAGGAPPLEVLRELWVRRR